MPASKLERSCSGKGCPGRRKPSCSIKVIRADSSLPAGQDDTSHQECSMGSCSVLAEAADPTKNTGVP